MFAKELLYLKDWKTLHMKTVQIRLTSLCRQLKQEFYINYILIPKSGSCRNLQVEALLLLMIFTISDTAVHNYINCIFIIMVTYYSPSIPYLSFFLKSSRILDWVGDASYILIFVSH